MKKVIIKSFAEALLLLLRKSVTLSILSWRWRNTELDVELKSLKLVKNKQETHKILTKSNKSNKKNTANIKIIKVLIEKDINVPIIQIM